MHQLLSYKIKSIIFILVFVFSRTIREWIRDHLLKKVTVLVDMDHNHNIDWRVEIQLVRLKVQIIVNTTRAAVSPLGVFHH